MADIFISYAREQRGEAQALAENLGAAGYEVWWDHQLVGGHDYEQALRTEINAARAIVVIWSNDAVGSSFVKGEARLALRLGKLIPVKLAGFNVDNLPLDFQAFHTVELEDGAGLRRALAEKVEPKAASPVDAGKAEPKTALPPSAEKIEPAAPPLLPRRRKWPLFAAAALAVVVLTAGGWGYSRYTYWQTQDELYAAALARNDLLAWDNYLASSPDERHAAMARAEIEKLTPEKQSEALGVFMEARSDGSVAAWQSYLERYQLYAKYLPPYLVTQAERMVAECKDVDLPSSAGDDGPEPGGKLTGPQLAWWCGSPQANATIAVQEEPNLLPGCDRYLAQYGGWSQNRLAWAAITDAKDGLNDLVFDEIMACKCRRGIIQEVISRPQERQRMICWLRVQPEHKS